MTKQKKNENEQTKKRIANWKKNAIKIKKKKGENNKTHRWKKWAG